ncbi:uncharacterized protein BJ171DRAFT_493551 [Polychytrium aggregatum]|uniref:uncharacterized protein n=1 Tax=Polychytrium aggregatum TaxID=110093 RepID=UPI0022FE564F|nr:uncharacterized protein BJ171DRAFT_493551 [Polychytrium aggregatum]KAI9207700.1 hypothetical protein BJ171DRAFT_493551 [Polychytrium aggregatum]
MRYQFVSLAFRLANGYWQHEESRPDGGRDVAYMPAWSSWRDYYSGTTELLRGYAICDCVREVDFQPDTTRKIIENRYFQMPNRPPLVYHTMFNDNGICHIKGRAFPELISPYFDSDPEWCDTIPGLLGNLRRRYGPGLIIYFNFGIHDGDKVKAARSLVQFARYAPDTLIVWRQTTPDHSGTKSVHHDEPVFEVFRNASLSNIAVMRIWETLEEEIKVRGKGSVFIDDLHVRPRINKLFSERLGQIVEQHLERQP